MKKFKAIEGLRGWLAWTVVISHVSQMTNIQLRGFGPWLTESGASAVIVFVMVSGFVITHLILERREPYAIYLLRRFMRLFPLLAVTCVIGYFMSDLYPETLPRVPWATDQNFALLPNLAAVSRSEQQFFWSHFFAHLTMLHGAISSNFLPFSLYAFNGPAWSLSLEWQFYLIAPAAIFFARHPRNAVWLGLLAAILAMAYNAELFGRFESPSFLPGALGYFAVGIACRLCLPALQGTVRHPNIILAVVVALIPLGNGLGLGSLLIWCLIITGLSLDGDSPDVTWFSKIYRHLLESPIATYFGARSYSIYLCHGPALGASLWAWLWIFPHGGKALAFLGVLFIEAVIVVISSEILYRSVELPGIAMGSWLARRVTGSVLASKSA